MNQTLDIARAEAGASTEWKDTAYDIIHRLSRRRLTFTCDDIWNELDKVGIDTSEHRALGGVLRAAVRDGLCQIRTCDVCGTRKVVVEAKREVRNGADTPVYESLIRARNKVRA